MYKIGDFSRLSKTTIKTLRYYEKEKLLIPAFIDPNTGYRYYETKQLVELSKIISLRQVGLSIKDIRSILNGTDMKILLKQRKREIEKNLVLYNVELSKINYLLEGENMNNEITKLRILSRPFQSRPNKRVPILQYSKDGQFIREWDSATSFGKHIGKAVSGNIIACINGKQPTAYGFKWKYKYDKD